MEDHVIGHMRHLAIKSLPVYDSGESGDSEKASAVESAIGSRSTVKKFMEKDSETAVISWGTDSGGVALSDSGTDHSRDQPSHEERLSARGVSTATPKRMDPDCAICGLPHVAMCDCEAKFVEECTEKAESKILGEIYGDARKWVREHAETHFKASLQAAVSRMMPGTDDGSGAQDTLAEAQQGADEVAAAARFDQLWNESAQTFPNFVEYFYSLIEFTLPLDDDHTVRDPPISALATKRSFDSNKEPEASESSMSSKEPSNQMPMVATGNSTVIEENPAFEGETEGGE
ncbi:hypothetical protein Daus18300_009061 [Diaporthe australafricana]|uniref:Uncharacterized protein n=1 Tax=Diaporthe australafricana TaxID=127596 RepID=A0ABR3WFU7_9PEZI